MSDNETELPLNPKQCEIARGWISECSWDDLEEDEIDQLSDSEVCRAIKRHFSGGIDAFIDSLLDDEK